MFFCGRLALFLGLGLSVILLSTASKTQAQMLELDELEGYEESSSQPEAAAWGLGIIPDLVSPESYPVLYGDHPFKSSDRNAFSPKTNAFLWTLAVKTSPSINTADDVTDDITDSLQSACLASSPFAPNLAYMGTACIPDTDKVIGFFKSFVSSIKIADLPEKVVCLLEQDGCEPSPLTALKVGQSPEKVPESSVSAVVWLGAAAVGALSTRFKLKKSQ